MRKMHKEKERLSWNMFSRVLDGVDDPYLIVAGLFYKPDGQHEIVEESCALLGCIGGMKMNCRCQRELELDPMDDKKCVIGYITSHDLYAWAYSSDEKKLLDIREGRGVARDIKFQALASRARQIKADLYVFSEGSTSDLKELRILAREVDGVRTEILFAPEYFYDDDDLILLCNSNVRYVKERKAIKNLMRMLREQRGCDGWEAVSDKLQNDNTRGLLLIGCFFDFGLFRALNLQGVDAEDKAIRPQVFHTFAQRGYNIVSINTSVHPALPSGIGCL